MAGRPPVYRVKKKAPETTKDRIEKMKALYGIKKREKAKEQEVQMPPVPRSPKKTEEEKVPITNASITEVLKLPPIQPKKADKFNSEYAIKVTGAEDKAKHIEEIEELKANDVKSAVDENEVDNLLQWAKELPEELSSSSHAKPKN